MGRAARATEGGKVMSKYIRAVVAAKAIADKYGIPLGDLVDTFADIPAADVVETVIYCDGCDMVYTLDDRSATKEQIAEAWNRRANDDKTE